MTVERIDQPETIPIDTALRLRKYSDDCSFALKWYQDEETLLLVDGKNTPYDMKRLYQMYHYLQKQGEVYFIEYQPDACAEFVPIGDVTFGKDDIPIVIGDRTLRGKGIGKRVIQALIDRAKSFGFPSLRVADIYDYNIGSQRLFESCGFHATTATDRGHSYELLL